MLEVLCIILGVLTVLMICSAIIFNISDGSYGAATVTVGAILLLSSILSIIDKTNPKAIDVYRGKTTLEITYKDGVAIDSIVIVKEK